MATTTKTDAATWKRQADGSYTNGRFTVRKHKAVVLRGQSPFWDVFDGSATTPFFRGYTFASAKAAVAAATKTIQAELEATNAQVVDKIDGRDVTRGELSAAFDRVKNREHWKNPIAEVVTVKPETAAFEIALIERAVVFFTGSVAEVTPLGVSGRMFHVKAAGYYAAIGA